jgi:ornithine carbamoyltransferase
VTRHFLEVDDLSATELADVLGRAGSGHLPAVLAGQGVALLFEKPSVRTRNSTEMAVVQLGGHPVTVRGEEVDLDRRETVEDVARVLAGYHAVIAARVMEHRTLERMVAALDEADAGVPVVNLLSDLAHPCQALADLLTIQERFGTLAGVRVAYVGDGNNVCRSLARACALAGAPVAVASPEGYGLSPAEVETVRGLGGTVTVTSDPVDAVTGAQVVYTDVWTSMGQEEESSRRRAAFAGFIVDEKLMAVADADAIVMHCLPAHRGEEISAAVVDGPQSVVFQQAANRMHSARGLLSFLVESTGRPVAAGVG